MSQIISIDLDSKYEYVNKYDDDKINDALLKYLLDSIDNFKDDIVLEVKFNYDINLEDKENAEKMFSMSFETELINTQKELKRLIVRDIIFMALGFVFFAIYYFLNKFNVFLFSEFFLVISWVAFWETVEGWLFSSRKLIQIKKKYQKLLRAKIKLVD